MKLSVQHLWDFTDREKPTKYKKTCPRPNIPATNFKKEGPGIEFEPPAVTPATIFGLFGPEHKQITIFRNVGNYCLNDTASSPRKILIMKVKKVVVVYFKIIAQHFLQGTEQNHSCSNILSRMSCIRE